MSQMGMNSFDRRWEKIENVDNDLEVPFSLPNPVCSGKDSMDPSRCPICQPFLHDHAIHFFGPPTDNPPRILRIHNLLDVESLGGPHRVHQAKIFIFELFVPLLHGFGAFFLPKLFQLVTVANFNAPVEG